MRSTPVKGTYRGYHATVVLQVVAAVEDIVFVVVLILHGNNNLGKARFELLSSLCSVCSAGIRVPTPRRIDLSELLVTTPTNFGVETIGDVLTRSVGVIRQLEHRTIRQQ